MVKFVHNNESAREGAEACEVLFDLYTGATGVVRLGRLLRGSDAGRLVMLRPVTREAAKRTRTLVERVRHISHPKLLKVMGCFRLAEQDYLVSEYIAGASLVELRAALSFGSSMELAVLIRVLRDALTAAHSGRRLLNGLYGYQLQRCVYEDAIWIAEFGEAFLTELAVFEAVVSERGSGSGVRGAPYVGQPDAACSADVNATGRILFDVLSKRSQMDGALFGLPAQVNKAVAGIVTRALSNDPDAGFKGPAGMAEALSQLSPALAASAEDVRGMLASALQNKLKTRREKLRLLERSSAVGGDDDRTQFHRASGLSALGAAQTDAPPARSGTHPARAVTVPAIPALKAPGAAQKALSADDVASTQRRVRRPSSGMHEHSFESQGHANAPALTPALGERGAPDAVLKPEALVASTGASPAQQPTAALAEDTQPARSDAVPDEPTTAWTSSVAHANAAQPELNEEATTIYIASKEQPAEPSVIIQDQDESNLYLRAKTGSSVNLAGTDERTVMCQRPSQQEFARYLVRQRFLWRLALVLGLVFASALLTLILARLRG